METRRAKLVLLVLAVVFSLYASSAAAQIGISRGCNPNGNVFNLAPLVNASLQGQANESVAMLPGRGENGGDLVLGAGLDYRQLVFNDGDPNPAYYVQRGNTNCAADFDGGVPGISVSLLGTFIPLEGYPQVVADPIHDVFFLDAVYASDTNLGIGVIEATAANFRNPSTCPNGTEEFPASCWSVGSVTNIVPENTGVANPSIAVDQRTQGTGAGDVYAVATWNQGLTQQIIVTACTNAELECGSYMVVSGIDENANFSSVQVRPDGGITISYANVVIEGTEYAEYQIKFVTCKPQGAPNAPTCGAPILVTDEKNPGVVDPGDEWNVTDVAFPRHVDRLESDGKTITTFLIYDQCAVPTYTAPEVEQDCPKTQIALTSSSDGGNTWSTIQPVSPDTPGQQFLGTIALDASTGTVNIAYYSSQNDPLRLRTQVFLAQIPPGQTSVGAIHQITATLYDGPTGFILFDEDSRSCCDYIGLAAAGTGQAGQSHAYIHFMGATDGILNGQNFPIYTNTLTRFEY